MVPSIGLMAEKAKGDSLKLSSAFMRKVRALANENGMGYAEYLEHVAGPVLDEAWTRYIAAEAEKLSGIDVPKGKLKK